jgi:hypothetical protein
LKNGNLIKNVYISFFITLNISYFDKVITFIIEIDIMLLLDLVYISDLDDISINQTYKFNLIILKGNMDNLSLNSYDFNNKISSIYVCLLY